MSKKIEQSEKLLHTALKQSTAVHHRKTVTIGDDDRPIAVGDRGPDSQFHSS